MDRDSPVVREKRLRIIIPDIYNLPEEKLEMMNSQKESNNLSPKLEKPLRLSLRSYSSSSKEEESALYNLEDLFSGLWKKIKISAGLKEDKEDPNACYAPTEQFMSLVTSIAQELKNARLYYRLVTANLGALTEIGRKVGSGEMGLDEQLEATAANLEATQQKFKLAVENIRQAHRNIQQLGPYRTRINATEVEEQRDKQTTWLLTMYSTERSRLDKLHEEHTESVHEEAVVSSTKLVVALTL
jgi:hypothetical protein